MSVPLSVQSRALVAPGVVFAEVDGETVLLDAKTGTYFGLDEVGTRVWSLIAGGAVLGDIQASLVSEFDVAAEVLWVDLVDLVGDMATNGLVSFEADNSPRP